MVGFVLGVLVTLVMVGVVFVIVAWTVQSTVGVVVESVSGALTRAATAAMEAVLRPRPVGGGDGGPVLDQERLFEPGEDAVLDPEVERSSSSLGAPWFLGEMGPEVEG